MFNKSMFAEYFKAILIIIIREYTGSGKIWEPGVRCLK